MWLRIEIYKCTVLTVILILIAFLTWKVYHIGDLDVRVVNSEYDPVVGKVLSDHFDPIQVEIVH